MRLYINIDHVATVRQARRTDEPDPVMAALAAERGGADGITAHLREDRRHIQDDDVRQLAAAVTTVLNLELATSSDIVALACDLRPFQATIVPERREEVTTEGGLDLTRPGPRLTETVRRLRDAGIRVSLFIDPDEGAIRTAVALGVPAIELHTGDYAHNWRRDSSALDTLKRAAAVAKDLGLAVHAGHGLTYLNVQPVAAIPEIEELNIGHSVVSRAVLDGMEPAVAAMAALVRAARK
jgi:pyridoxine 5-phosphate synthase